MSHYYWLECRTCTDDNRSGEYNHGDADLVAAWEQREMLSKVERLLNDWWQITGTFTLPGAPNFVANHATHEVWLIGEHGPIRRLPSEATS